jgi:flagellar biosynthesis protein FlhF
MRLKSYFALNMEAALDMARQELGPEAMIVNSRPSPPEARHLGEYEVVFTIPPATSSSSATPQAQADESITSAVLLNHLAGMRQQIEELKKTVFRSGRSLPFWEPSSEMADLYAHLTAGGVARDLAQAVLASACTELAGEPLAAVPEISRSRTRERARAADAERLERCVVAEMESRIDVAPELGKVVVLVGPPGAGKTTALIKLAVARGLTQRKSTQLLSMDAYRVAAGEQLRTYAAILGTGFEALETTRSLEHALEEHRNKDLILIDTPGFGAGEMDAATDLAGFLAAQPGIDIHLVLPSYLTAEALASAAERYEIFRPSKLLFTRLDETDALGALFSLAAGTQKPLSFFSHGQRIPEDLAPAAKGRILDSIFGSRVERVLSAA